MAENTEPGAAHDGDPVAAARRQFDVTVYVNTTHNFGYGDNPQTEPVATAPDLRLAITATDPVSAAEQAFVIGNSMDADDNGRRWPTDVRSASVGDLMKVVDEQTTTYYRVASVGFDEIPEPANPVVALNRGRPSTDAPLDWLQELRNTVTRVRQRTFEQIDRGLRRGPEADDRQLPGGWADNEPPTDPPPTRGPDR